MQRLLVLNLFISMLWPILNSDYTLRNLLIGFAFGFVLLSIVQRKYGLYTYRAARFGVYVLWAILQSNLRLAAKVLAGAVGMPTRLRSGGTRADRSATVAPRSSTAPASGDSNPASSLSTVVLPHPLGPRRHRICPDASVKDTSEIAVTSPNRLVTFRNSATGSFTAWPFLPSAPGAPWEWTT